MNRTIRNLSLVACALAAMLTLIGCSGGTGKFSIRNTSDDALSSYGKFTTALYRYGDKNDADVLLIEGPADSPTQVVHLQMTWIPRAGRTPIDAFATNATLRYVVFTEDGAGVYGGGGFFYPRGKPGGDTFAGNLRGASLRLLDASVDYEDKLGLASATGGFSAKRDDVAVARLLQKVETHLSKRLGYPTFVQRDALWDIALLSNP